MVKREHTVVSRSQAEKEGGGGSIFLDSSVIAQLGPSSIDVSSRQHDPVQVH